jgi:hypothetical protein
MAAQAPQSSVFDQQAAGALVAAPLARELPPFPDVRAGRFLPRPPADRSPPLFVVNCSFRC